MPGEYNNTLSVNKENPKVTLKRPEKTPKTSENTKDKLDKLLGVVAANKLIGKPFKVDDQGNVIGERTGKKYTSVDIGSLHQLNTPTPSANYTLFADKSATYIRFTQDATRLEYNSNTPPPSHFNFIKLEGSDGQASFPYVGEHKTDNGQEDINSHWILTSNGNIYVINKSGVDFNKINLYGNKWIPGKSRILAMSQYEKYLFASFDGKKIVDMRTGEILPFTTTNAKFIHPRDLGHMVHSDTPRLTESSRDFVVYIKKGSTEAVYDPIEKSFSGVNDWLDKNEFQGGY